MDRVAIPVRTSDGCTGILDQSVDGFASTANGSGTSSLGPCPTQSLLPGSEESANQPQRSKENQETRAAEEVVPQQIWFQLSASERQRFGHCFSFMVLKALGLRSHQDKEVKQ